MRVGVDCDGPMYDFPEAYRQLAMEEDGITDDSYTYANRWCFWEQWPGWNFRRWMNTYARWVEESDYLLTGLPPKENVTAAFDRMEEAGHELWVVTSLNCEDATRTARAQRLEWLARWGLVPTAVYFTPHKDKTGVPFDVMIDDHPSTLEAVLDAHPGTLCLLVDLPHNSEYDETGSGIARVGSLYDAAVYLGA